MAAAEFRMLLDRALSSPLVHWKSRNLGTFIENGYQLRMPKKTTLSYVNVWFTAW